MRLTSLIGNILPLAPPMGWRSWNAFQLKINQTQILAQVDALSTSTPERKSLLELGFSEVGIDDGWQCCIPGDPFHDHNGYPVVNTTKFPDLLAMTTYASQKNVSMGWYVNNCWCNEAVTAPDLRTYQQDVDFAIQNGFTGLKVDGCGPNVGIHKWTDAVARSTATPPHTVDTTREAKRSHARNSPKRKLSVENCANNPHPPDRQTPEWAEATPDDVRGDRCTYDLYRVSEDIAPQFLSTMWNLQRTVVFDGRHNSEPLSRPGCWAYPDMLQVGRLANSTEDEAHFGAWCITSSPLILGFDLTNSVLMDRVYPIISNPLALTINQIYAGEPGHLALNSSETFKGWVAHGAKTDADCHSPSPQCELVEFPIYQVWVKALTKDKHVHGLYVINLSSENRDVRFKLSDVGLLIKSSSHQDHRWVPDQTYPETQSSSEQALSNTYLTDVWSYSEGNPDRMPIRIVETTEEAHPTNYGELDRVLTFSLAPHESSLTMLLRGYEPISDGALLQQLRNTH